jgi:hypothetical protein
MGVSSKPHDVPWLARVPDDPLTQRAPHAIPRPAHANEYMTYVGSAAFQEL